MTVPTVGMATASEDQERDDRPADLDPGVAVDLARARRPGRVTAAPACDHDEDQHHADDHADDAGRDEHRHLELVDLVGVGALRIEDRLGRRARRQHERQRADSQWTEVAHHFGNEVGIGWLRSTGTNGVLLLVLLVVARPLARGDHTAGDHADADDDADDRQTRCAPPWGPSRSGLRCRGSATRRTRAMIGDAFSSTASSMRDTQNTRATMPIAPKTGNSIGCMIRLRMRRFAAASPVARSAHAAHHPLEQDDDSDEDPEHEQLRVHDEADEATRGCRGTEDRPEAVAAAAL